MDKSGTQVSIILPCHNADPALLTRTVDSVLAQSYQSFELLFVDDGSEAAFAQALERKLKGIRASGSLSRMRRVSPQREITGSAARRESMSRSWMRMIRSAAGSLRRPSWRPGSSGRII